MGTTNNAQILTYLHVDFNYDHIKYRFKGFNHYNPNTSNDTVKDLSTLKPIKSIPKTSY